MTDDGLDIGEPPREWMYGDNVAIANRGQGHEAEIDQVANDGKIILKGRQATERITLAQSDKTIQRYKDKADTEIQQDGADDTVKRDRPGANTARATTTPSVMPRIIQAVASR